MVTMKLYKYAQEIPDVPLNPNKVRAPEAPKTAPVSAPTPTPVSAPSSSIPAVPTVPRSNVQKENLQGGTGTRAPVTPNDLPNEFKSSKSTAVEAMQKQMVAFARDAVMALSILNPTNHDRGESKSFETSLIQDYFKRSGINAQGTNVYHILDTITRIGGANAETTPDGIWGTKTTTALNQMYGLAFGIYELEKDLGENVSQWSLLLGELKNLLAKNTPELKNKDELATEITKSLFQIRKLFNTFKDRVLEPHQSFINQDQSVISLFPKENEFNENEQKLIEKQRTLPVGNINGVTILVQDLFTPGAFTKKLESASVDVKNVEQVKAQINNIRNQLNKNLLTTFE